jgi:aminopeptidase N
MIHLWGVRPLEEHVSRFLDEGITHYIEAWLLKVEIGEDAYWDRMARFRQTFASGGDTAASVPLAEAGCHREVREAISRGKGPWLVCVLHHLIGDDFFPALRAFLGRYRDCGATPEDFETAFSQAARVGLSRFFHEWLWGTESSAYLAQDLSEEELVCSLVEGYR